MMHNDNSYNHTKRYDRVNAFGQYFGHIKASDLVLVDHTGSIVRGNYTVNRAAFVIHAAVHEARPDVTCAVHT